MNERPSMKQWRSKTLAAFLAKGGSRRETFETPSGIPVEPLCAPPDGECPDYEQRLGYPGEFPYARGVYPSMYRGRLWTMRQYAGFGSARETNARFRYLLERGQTGISVAFDLPTQMGHDSDAPLAEGEVGRVGVAIDTIADMRALLDGLPLDRLTTSMTINATAAVLLAMYVAVAEERGVPRAKLGGTIQNDILKEYIARGTYISPPGPSMRLVTDTFAFCAEHMPRWNPISISGYHIREAGSTAVQELAFTLSNAIAYVGAAVDAGLDVNRFGGRLSFFFNSHRDFFEEVAKFRAARRMWARIMKERFNATEPKAMQLRFHTQTAGSTLSAEEPENNAVRVALQALAAVMGGTQSLHTNSRDEALSLPTEESALLALRTQQVIAHESGVASAVDPLGGSWHVERLTDEVERRAWEEIGRVDNLGGAVAAIEARYFQERIAQAAYEAQKRFESGEDAQVAVNAFLAEKNAAGEPLPAMTMNPALEAQQRASLAAFKTERDSETAARAVQAVRRAAEGTENLLPPILEAVRASATLGEIAGAMRGVFGEYRG